MERNGGTGDLPRQMGCVPFAAPNPSPYLVVVSLSLALFSEGVKLSPHLVLVIYIGHGLMGAARRERERERERERGQHASTRGVVNGSPRSSFSHLVAVADCVCVWFCGQAVVFGWCPFTGLKGDVWGKDHPNGELVSLPGHSGHSWFPSCYAVIQVWDLCPIASKFIAFFATKICCVTSVHVTGATSGDQHNHNSGIFSYVRI